MAFDKIKSRKKAKKQGFKLGNTFLEKLKGEGRSINNYLINYLLD